MGNTKLYIEAMNASNVWQDITVDTMSALIEGVGMSDRRANNPAVGRCTLKLKNQSQAYNPAIDADGSAALLETQRRLRVRASGATLGNCLQVKHSGLGGLGGTTTITATGALLAIGNNGGTTYRQAQSFQVTAGRLSQFTVRHGANVGTPTSTVTWQICTDNGNKPGAVLATGTYTPTASATNTISGLTGTGLSANTKYWLVLFSTGAQTSGNYWQWQGQATSTYANGNVSQSTDAGATWTDQPTTDAQCAITTSIVLWRWQASKVISGGIGDVLVLSFEARAPFDSQYNQDNVRLALNSETSAFNLLSYTNKWKTYSFTFTTTFTYTSIAPQFWALTGDGTNATQIEYRNISLTINGGANVLVNGNFSTGAISPWTSVSDPNISGSVTLTVAPDTWILFNGAIEDILPAPFATAGDRTCTVIALDGVDALRRQKHLNLTLAKNKRSDELIALALAALPTGTLGTTLPGILQETGIQTFPKALDAFTNEETSIQEVADAAVSSEYGRWYIDRDGTFRSTNRTFTARQIVATPKLTLTDGQPFGMTVARRSNTLYNNVALVWHPRDTKSSTQAIATITSPITIPPLQPGGVPGTITITLNFKDPDTGKAAGGDNIQALTATTDYLINERSDGSGVNYTTNPNFTISVVSTNASQIVLKLNNTATGPLYATKLQVRGQAVVTYDPKTISLSDSASIANKKQRDYKKDLAFNDDENFATSLGQYLLRYANSFAEVPKINAEYKAQINGVDLLGIELMDVIAITDAQTGLTGQKHIVTAVNYNLTPQAGDYIAGIELVTARLDNVSYWILGDATYGVLDSTTRLYI